MPWPVIGAEDGGAVGVPVDRAEGGQVQVHAEERGGRGEQGGGDQGLDRGDVADDEDGLAAVIGQDAVQRGGDRGADVGEAPPGARRRGRPAPG
jgi:hypothetical protein